MYVKIGKKIDVFFSERVLEGGGSESMTKVIVNAITTYRGVNGQQLRVQLASFGVATP